MRLSDGKRNVAPSSPLRFRNLFHNKSLPWLLDASVSSLDTFHVVCYPFICLSTGEELLTVVVSLGCFETRECFTSFDMSALQVIFRI